MILNKQTKYQVFVSERHTGKHAEVLMLEELPSGTFPKVIKNFYVSSTPCYHCTPKIFNTFNDPLPTIFVSRVFKLEELRENTAHVDAVIRLLVRGFKIQSLDVQSIVQLMKYICPNKGKLMEWRRKLCHDAQIMIESRAGHRRHAYTTKILKILETEAETYEDVDDDGEPLDINDEYTPYTKASGVNAKLIAEINKYQNTCD